MTRRLVAGLIALLAIAACDRAPEITAWQEGPEGRYRWRTLDVRSREGAGFRQLSASATGVTHRNLVADSNALRNRHLLLGAGVAAGDFDADGLADLFVASLEQPAVLYRNRGGFRFEDVTERAGLATAGLATTSAAAADVNGDGHLDLLVGTLGGPLKLWTGDGRGRFSDATMLAGLLPGYATTALTLGDIDGDGDLDLYVGTYKTRNTLDAYAPQLRAFDQVVKKVGDRYTVVPEWDREYRIEERPELGGIMRSQRAERDHLYINNGLGWFQRAITRGDQWRDESGRPITVEPDYFTLAARFYDVNGDLAPDLYVCNDFEDPDQFWINDGRGNFRLVPWLTVRETSNTCMAVAFGDVNRDGHVDFFTADMMSPELAQRQRQFPTHTPLPKQPGLATDRQQWMRNTLQLARGDGTWASIADFAGVAGTDWTWGSAFLDVDLDGHEDLIALNGHRWDVRDADTFERIRNSFPRVPWNREQGEFPVSATRSFAFRNNGDLTFADMSRAWGIGRDAAISHGIALADFDGDGDLDVVASRLNDAPAIFRNDASAARVAVRLAGDGRNRHGIGARVIVRAPGRPEQSREMTAGGYYLSGSEPLLVFAAGEGAVAIEVRWRSGRVSRIADARANRLYEIRESAAQPADSSARAEPLLTTSVDSLPPLPANAGLFENATALLGGHVHVDSAFDDYRRQPLLPNKFSQLGPGVTWTDADGDGRVDLAVGAGRGSRMTLLRNVGGRRFAPVRVGGEAQGDHTTILPINAGGGRVTLLAGQSNYEARSSAEALRIPRVISIDPRSGAASTLLPADTAAVGPLALGDVNGDGRLDLFVGARVVPGAWPLPAPSRVYLRRPDGGWVLDSANANVVGSLGLVSAALFTDLDADGWPELVATAEWGPIRVLSNQRGRLVDGTAAWGLSGRSSRWNGLAAGDFDGDGALDLVATSWGRNTPWGASAERPHVLVAGNFGGQGLGLVFARADSATGREMPLQSFERIALAVPTARTRIATFADYAKASVEDVLGERAAGAVRVGATTYDHLVLLNRNEKFDARPLPPLAQLAPAFAAVVADYDGDGREDLFLAQNFSPTEIETPRLDAGAGVVLLGEGNGAFRALSVLESGIRVLGDQRGAAAADFDGDGRVDLAVSQNGAATTLWRNRAAQPGLRVRLDGGTENPNGIGAVVRLGGGPAREIRAGSGYWSVDDPVTVLAPSPATELHVRWPGGVLQRVPVAAGQREIRVVRP